MFPVKSALSFLIGLAIILSVSGTPAPQKLQLTPVLAANGRQHSWHGWEPDENFQGSSLRSYAEVVHEEITQKSKELAPKLGKMRLPGTVASLWVKNKGIYSATDFGNFKCRTESPLHPKTRTLLQQCSTGTNRSGGHCSCIQAINGFYEKFPNEDIPWGSQMVIYGHRDGKQALEKALRPCRADNFAPGCGVILSAAGIESKHDPKAPDRSGSSRKRKPELGSDISHPQHTSHAFRAHRKAAPDLDLPPEQ